MDLGLAGRVALVTGGGGGIGRAIAERFALEGCRVAVLGRTPETLEATCDAIRGKGAEGLALVADLSDPASLDAAVDTLAGTWGDVEVLVHSAAHFSPRVRLERAGSVEWERSLDVNLEGVAHLSARVLGGMKRRKWGRVVMVGSMMGQAGGRGYAIYGTLKAAQEGLSRAIALDYGSFGITSNVVAPGFIDTEIFRERSTQELAEEHATASVLGRLGRPEEVAQAVAFLASEAAGFITGTTLNVGGGAHLNTRW